MVSDPTDSPTGELLDVFDLVFGQLLVGRVGVKSQVAFSVVGLGVFRGPRRYRVFIDIMRNKGAFPNARCFHGHNGPKPITVWCSNDYLAMGQHPKVIEAMEEALHDVGAGSGGTRNIGGNTHYHVQLEAELSDLHGKDAALLFTSGYVSNDATLSTVA